MKPKRLLMDCTPLIIDVKDDLPIKFIGITIESIKVNVRACEKYKEYVQWEVYSVERQH